MVLDLRKVYGQVAKRRAENNFVINNNHETEARNLGFEDNTERQTVKSVIAETYSGLSGNRKSIVTKALINLRIILPACQEITLNPALRQQVK